MSISTLTKGVQFVVRERREREKWRGWKEKRESHVGRGRRGKQGVNWTAATVNPLPTNDCKTRHETFTFMMSHPAMSLGHRLCASRKGGAGGGGWVHPKGANSMAVSGLSFKQPLVGAG